MHDFIRLAAAAALGLAVTATAGTAANITRKIPVDETFLEGALDNSGSRGGIELAIKVIEVNNVFELCVAVRYTNSETWSINKSFLRDSDFTINGRKVVKGMDYFERASGRNGFKGAVASCKSTGVRVFANPQFDIKWSRRAYTLY